MKNILSKNKINENVKINLLIKNIVINSNFDGNQIVRDNAALSISPSSCSSSARFATNQTPMFVFCFLISCAVGFFV